MILCRRHSAKFWRSCKTCNGLVATWGALGPSCPRNHTVRNVWRAPFGEQFSRLDAMCNISYDFHGFAHTRLRNLAVRNVWRALALGSAESLGSPSGRQAAQTVEEWSGDSCKICSAVLLSMHLHSLSQQAWYFPPAGAPCT